MSEAEQVSDLLAARRAKLERLRAQGVDPFPHAFPGVTPAAEALAGWDELEPGQETDSTHRVAGRLAARRGQGKMAFLDLVDRSGRIQLQARADVLGEEPMATLLDLEQMRGFMPDPMPLLMVGAVLMRSPTWNRNDARSYETMTRDHCPRSIRSPEGNLCVAICSRSPHASFNSSSSTKSVTEPRILAKGRNSTYVSWPGSGLISKSRVKLPRGNDSFGMVA